MSRSWAPPIATNGKRSSSKTAGASPRVSRCSTSLTRNNGTDGDDGPMRATQRPAPCLSQAVDGLYRPRSELEDPLMPAHAAEATAPAKQARWPNFRESDFVIKDYVFRSGERLPEL